MRPTCRTSDNYPVMEQSTLLPFLLSTLKGKSRNNVKSLLRRDLVAVDGRPVRQFDTPLSPGQQVTILTSPVPSAGGNAPFPILYEDEHLLVINKPPKLLTVANDREKERTAYRQATAYVKAQHVDNRLFIVHRLDRDTSGVLLFARDLETKRLFQENWDKIITRRGYIAVVEGRPEPERDTIRSYLVETETHLVFSGAPGPGAREAVTHYETLRTENGYSLLNLSIDTGRKNQIRVHMKDIGCPVAGDRQYGAKTNPIRRLCLHASELSFVHPETGEPITFRAKMPRDFRRLIALSLV